VFYECGAGVEKKAMREIRISILVITSILIAVGIVMVYSASAIHAHETFGDSLFFFKKAPALSSYRHPFDFVRDEHRLQTIAKTQPFAAFYIIRASGHGAYSEIRL